jgi:hypothetical protein
VAQNEEPPARQPRKLLWLAIGGVVLSVTLLIVVTVFGHRFPSWIWSDVLQLVGLIVLTLTVVSVLLTLLIRAARSRAWTGFVDKTLWDWFQLLIIPLVLAIGGFWFATVQDNRQQELEDQRAQDTALQAYIDQMSELLLRGDLRGSEEGDEVRTLARARTLTVLERVEADRKGQVLRFLFEANLVNSSDPVISLAGADLQDAVIVTEETIIIWPRGRRGDWRGTDWRGINLSGAYLPNAYIVTANLSGADLSGADLWNADLRGARGLTDEQITAAESLEGATMPNGQKYEDWLKSKSRGEEGEATSPS